MPGVRLAGVLLVLAAAVAGLSAQDVARGSASRGQNVVPVYEGWERAPDGTIHMLFGYLNRNWDEAIDVPIGADNSIAPGGPDRGQPTHFQPRRSYFVFKVLLPKNFPENGEVVWTLTSRGRTQRAYGTLKPGYFTDKGVIAMNHGGGSNTTRENELNQPPTLAVEGESAVLARVGQPVALAAVARDDGIPRTRSLAPLDPRRTSGLTVTSATGLRVAWFVYRGSGGVTFDPPQFKTFVDMREGSPWTPGWQMPPLPPDGRWVARATFHEPGEYVLRCLAHDGMLPIYQDVTVVVK